MFPLKYIPDISRVIDWNPIWNLESQIWRPWTYMLPKKGPKWPKNVNVFLTIRIKPTSGAPQEVPVCRSSVHRLKMIDLKRFFESTTFDLCLGGGGRCRWPQFRPCGPKSASKGDLHYERNWNIPKKGPKHRKTFPNRFQTILGWFGAILEKKSKTPQISRYRADKILKNL